MVFVAYCLIGSSYNAVLLSECNNRIQAHNKFYWFQSNIPQSLRRPRRPKFSSEYLTEMFLGYISWPSAIKSGIVSNNRHSKLYVVIDCLFLKNASLEIQKVPIILFLWMCDKTADQINFRFLSSTTVFRNTYQSSFFISSIIIMLVKVA